MDPQNKKDPIDPASFLLPKKEAPAPAQRINAGALLEQEQRAGSEGLPKNAAPAPLVPPTPKEDRPEVSPLQTYRGDIEQMVQEGKGVSVVSIAAAEAERRGNQPPPVIAEEKRIVKIHVALVAAGVLLLALAAGTIAFIFLHTTSVPGPESFHAPFIFVDDTALVSLPADKLSRSTLMANLQAARTGTHLSLGLIKWIYIAEPGSAADGVPRELRTAELLQLLAPQAPPELLRTLTPAYLLGVHSFEENQSFLLLQVDSYETAYRAMLQWEDTLQGDLLPLFSRNPSPRLPVHEADALVNSPTSTSVGGTTPQFLKTGFVDKIVENRDTRVYLNSAGDILLLWTFLGRDIILITTNEYTLREVLSRLTAAPVVPIPGK